MLAGHKNLTVSITDDYGTRRARAASFAYVELQRAAVAGLNMLTAEQYEIIANAIHGEHVVRVFTVKKAMDDHPPMIGHSGIPPIVRRAVDELKQFEALMEDLRVDRLPPEDIHERMAALAAEGGSR